MLAHPDPPCSPPAPAQVGGWGTDDELCRRVMVFWWCALGVLLAVVYMVTYTLLRTSADDRPWYARLRHPKGGTGRSGTR